MKKITCEYISSWTYAFGQAIPTKYRRIPSNNTKLTGRYKEINKKIYVEVEEKHFFGLITKNKWISENEFEFYEVEYFDCNKSKNFINRCSVSTSMSPSIDNSNE